MLDGHLEAATVWQSIAQMRAGCGDAKDTLKAASTDKLFVGPITDKTTRDEVVDLIGRDKVHVDGHETLVDKDGARRLTWGRALLVSGSLPPAVVRFRPYWGDRNAPPAE